MSKATSPPSTKKILVASLCVVMLTVLILQNTEEVRTRFLFAELSLPRAVLILTTVAIGFVLGCLFAFGKGRRASREADGK